MPFRAVGLLLACIAGESRAFVASPTIATAIITSQHKTTTSHVLAMGKKGGAKRKTRRQLDTFRGAVEEEEGEKIARGVAAGQEDEDRRSVPRLVVMDLDYTLW